MLFRGLYCHLCVFFISTDHETVTCEFLIFVQADMLSHVSFLFRQVMMSDEAYRLSIKYGGIVYVQNS